MNADLKARVLRAMLNWPGNAEMAAEAAIREVVEACAAEAQNRDDGDNSDDFDEGWNTACTEIAAAIRGIVK